MTLSDDARRNRTMWDGYSDEYQQRHAGQLAAAPRAWGVWRIPDAELGAVGEVAGKDVLELGCGAAQWAIALAQDGARVVGLDNSPRQLDHAREGVAAAGVTVDLVLGSAEAVPLPDASFDVVLSDHGAMSWCDPERTVAEVARLLRPGGLLAFCLAGPLSYLCWDEATDEVLTELRISQFDLGRFPDKDGSVSYCLPHGEWIRLFAEHGLAVERLWEIQAPAGGETTYADFVPHEWARRWPAEDLWRVRKVG